MGLDLLALVSIIAVLVLSVAAQRVAYEKRLSRIRDVVADIGNGNSNRRVRAASGSQKVREIENGLNAMTAAFQKTLLDKRKIEKAQRLLVSHVSHDLRTPLTSIIGYVDALISDADLESGEREEFLRIVKGKCAFLNDLIDEFFTLSKLELDEEKPRLERVDLRAAAENVLISFYRDLTGLSLEPVIHTPEHAVYVYGVGLYIERILTNLISNTIRHSQGATTIDFSIEENGDRAVCSLTDNGSGIAVRDLPFLFENPFAGSESSSPLETVRGLGLSIVKRLLDKMEGEISVASVPYERTTFVFTLKRAI
jgi:two-component system phosphate regulon sensor histidine kinase PhoR